MSIPNVVSIILARGGSKGLPRKNIQLLDGMPLIAYSILAAQQSLHIRTVYVATEDVEIATIARKYGAEIIAEPPELASDLRLPNEVLREVVLPWFAAQQVPVDILVYLQITDLFRQKGIIDQAIERLATHVELDSVFAAYPDHKNYWRKTGEGYRKLAPDIANVARQQKEYLFREDTGIVCATRPETIRRGTRIGERVDIVMNDTPFSSIDIHTEQDLWLAEQVVKKYRSSGLFAF